VPGEVLAVVAKRHHYGYVTVGSKSGSEGGFELTMIRRTQVVEGSKAFSNIVQGINKPGKNL
jgi:hypothetical protein